MKKPVLFFLNTSFAPPLELLKTRAVQGVEAQEINGCFAFNTVLHNRTPNVDITTKHAAQKVQASIRLGEKAEDSARVRLSIEAQLRMQQRVNERQCDAVQKVVIDLQNQLDALRSFKDYHAKSERKSTLETSKLALRLQECEAQLVVMHIQRENAMKNMEFLQNLIGAERTGNRQAILVISELKREKEALKRRIEDLECVIRAKKSRSQFADAVNKVLHVVRRKRRLAEARTFMAAVSEFKSRIKQAEVRALVWKAAFYAQVPLLKQKSEDCIEAEYLQFDNSIAKPNELQEIHHGPNTRTRTATASGDLESYQPIRLSTSQLSICLGSPVNGSTSVTPAIASQSQETRLLDIALYIDRVDKDGETPLFFQAQTKHALDHIRGRVKVALRSSKMPCVTRLSPTRATPSTCSEDPLDKAFGYLSSPPPYAALQESGRETNNENPPPILAQNSLTRGSRPFHINPTNKGNQTPLQQPQSACLPYVVQSNAVAIRQGEQRRVNSLRHEQPSRVPSRHCPSRASVFNVPSNALPRNVPTSAFTHSRGAREAYRTPPAPNVGVSARHGPSPFQRASSPKLRPASIADYHPKLWRS